MNDIKVNELYDSEVCALVDITASGKKNTYGVLTFKGKRSFMGSGEAVRALENGVVLYAGRDMNIHSRTHQRGVVVTLTCHEGVTISYERLATRTVSVGDVVHAGDIIGYEGNTGAGKEQYLNLRFSRNGRLIDGCDYLGIPRKPTVFKPASLCAESVVCKAFGLTDSERASINTLPQAPEIWRKLYESRRVWERTEDGRA